LSEFLPDFDDRLPWSGKKKHGAVTPVEMLRGSTETDLVVVLGEAATLPPKGDVAALWKERAGQSMDPVLVAVVYPDEGQDRVVILGPDRDAVPVSAIELYTAERLIGHALGMESPTGLVAEMRRRLASLRGGVGPGFRNEGLFATHVLAQQPQRPDWQQLCRQSQPLLASRGEGLLTRLGYKFDHVADGVVLRDAKEGSRRAAAVLLLDDESMDNPLSRFHGSNAVTHGLALARRESVPWLIVLGGGVARLYPVNPDIGVGRKGQTQTYVEVDLDLLTEATAGYLSLLFAPDALAEDGTVTQLLAESSKYAVGLSERLRDRIYETVIPNLAVAIAAQSDIWDKEPEQQRAALDDAYHQSMIVLFRLLFVAYAEDRGLLPLDVNETYTSNALKTLARRILNDPATMESDTSTSIWDDLTQIWKVIDRGDLQGMGVPAYNGGLFTTDVKKNPAGAATYSLDIVNADIGPVIEGLMIDDTIDGERGLVDFRSLDVREFGTIYEGLLESGLDIATTDLTVDSNDTYIPADKGDDIWIEADSVYFHSRSGSRKATGSYFTKPFAVQHLLDQALEPAITAHLERVKALIEKGAHKSAAEALFDFRVADLSMGSAHFLVAAVDRIEARFSEFLALNPLAEVTAELHTLRTTATNQLGIPPENSGIDDGILLRRQIARRCIYGIDINEIAVELARLAVWIHTFVPGLPLSFLNHGLVHGNSLTGVGTLEEIVEALEEARQREDKKGDADILFDLSEALRDFVDRAAEHLAQLGALTDVSIADVNQASEIQVEIEATLEPLKALCDLITAEHTTRHLKPSDPDKIWLIKNSGLRTVTDGESLEAAVLTHPQLDRAREVAASVDAIHLPTAFPEVLRRDPSGFDCLLGNPPWDEVTVEAPKFWQRFFPGLLGLKPDKQRKKIKELIRTHAFAVPDYEREVAAAEKYRKTLLALPFPGLGTGDVDFYQVFAWRTWQVLRPNGYVGMVFPRSLLNSAGCAEWRRLLLREGQFRSVVSTINTGKWVFDEVHAQYSIVLICLEKTPADQDSSVQFAGPFHSLAEFTEGRNDLGALSAAKIGEWATGSAFPLLGSVASVSVFETMRAHPRLDRREPMWDFRPVAELHATNDRMHFDAGGEAKGRLAVYTGSTFDLWAPDTGEYYAWADPEIVTEALQRKLANQVKHSKSAFFGLSEEWAADPKSLPMRRPRIAFRDITNATNTRTLLAALIPGGHPLVNTAPYLARIRGTERHEAYLLGVLSSLPLDWYARRYIELHANLHIVNGLPVPRPPDDAVSARIIEIAGRLAAVDKRYTEWAHAVGVPVGSVQTDSEKDELIAELDALVSIRYGLDRRQIDHIFATFHRGWDYRRRLGKVLGHFDVWTAKLAEGV
jgi:hypothetical protein